MQLAVTYIRHNCFLLQCGSAPDAPRFLFDYPTREHLDDQARDLVREALAGANAVIFASHGHADHFTPEILEFKSITARAQYVVSYDIAELYPGFDPEEDPSVTAIEPDEERRIVVQGIGEMRVRGFESTDQGVGFLMQLPGLTIWFGGDVAAWSWEQLAPQARAFSEKHYAETLAQLQAYSIDLAFVNADKRLPNWAGGLDFLRMVAPRYCAPMHCFGNAAWSAEFAELARGCSDCVVWSYAASGDTLRIEA